MFYTLFRYRCVNLLYLARMTNALFTSTLFYMISGVTAQFNSSDVILPPGTSNHGNPHLICFPAKWSDVAVFFIGNYVAHAATTVTSPGLPPLRTFVKISGALLFPISGISSGLYVIFSLPIFGSTDLKKAARAGALCCVARQNECTRSIIEARLVGDYKRKYISDPWPLRVAREFLTIYSQMVC